MTRTFGTPPNKPSQATLLSPLRVNSRAENGRTGAAKGRVTRSLTVNNGHSKTDPDLGRNPLTMHDARLHSGFDSPSSIAQKMVIYQGFCRS